MTAASLLALGLYLVVAAFASQKVANTRWVWALLFALIFDNICFGMIGGSTSVAGSVVSQLISSSLMALAGVLASVPIVRAIPKVAPEQDPDGRDRRCWGNRRSASPAVRRLIK